MKTRTITVRVPSWFPTGSRWRDIRATYNTIKFKMRPYTCVDCGCGIDFKFPEFHYQPLGKKCVILHMVGLNIVKTDNQGVCGKCVGNRISTLFSRIKPLRSNSKYGTVGTKKQACDACGKTKATLGISTNVECNIRFGSSWWNGHHICEECLVDAALLGTQSSGVMAYLNGKLYNTNGAGACIGLTNWYELLKKRVVPSVPSVAELPPPPAPPPGPLSRLICEDVWMGPLCELCGSSTKGKWFWQAKSKGCIQPKCTDYYNKDIK